MTVAFSLRPLLRRPRNLPPLRFGLTMMLFRESNGVDPSLRTTAAPQPERNAFLCALRDGVSTG